MTKTEAAQILGLKAKIWARDNGHKLDKDLVEAIMSEAIHWPGLFPEAANTAPSWKTVLREAKK